jgi:hypothetical protein
VKKLATDVGNSPTHPYGERVILSLRRRTAISSELFKATRGDHKEVLDDVAELLRQREGGDADPLVASARHLISLINDLAVKIAVLERLCRLLEKITETTDEALTANLMSEAFFFSD